MKVYLFIIKWDLNPKYNISRWRPQRLSNTSSSLPLKGLCMCYSLCLEFSSLSHCKAHEFSSSTSLLKCHHSREAFSWLPIWNNTTPSPLDPLPGFIFSSPDILTSYIHGSVSVSSHWNCISFMREHLSFLHYCILTPWNDSWYKAGAQ